MGSEDAKKIIAAALALPLFVWLVGWGGPAQLLYLVLPLAAGLGALELTRLSFGREEGFHKLLLVLVSLFLCLASQSGESELTLLALCSTSIVVLCALLFTEEDLSRVLPESSRVIFGALYVGLLSGLVVALKRLEADMGGAKLVLTLFALVWAGDAGAFFIGSRIGRHKLWPRVSAKKTWEGLAGGFACTMLAALIVAAISEGWLVKDALIFGSLVGLAGPAGDLVESAIKRGAGVKDSGRFLPGHGGVLDRIDSILFALPVFYFYVLAVGPARWS